jgi:hypothetical protein
MAVYMSSGPPCKVVEISSNAKGNDSKFNYSTEFLVPEDTRNLLIKFSLRKGHCVRVSLGGDRLKFQDGHLVVYTVEEKGWTKSTFVFKPVTGFGLFSSSRT